MPKVNYLKGLNGLTSGQILILTVTLTGLPRLTEHLPALKPTAYFHVDFIYVKGLEYNKWVSSISIINKDGTLI